MTTIMYVSAILAVVIILTIIGVLPRRPEGLRGDVLKHMNSFKYI